VRTGRRDRERTEVPALRYRWTSAVPAVATVALVAHQGARIFAVDEHVRVSIGAAVAAGLVATILAAAAWPLRLLAAAVAAVGAATAGVLAVDGELPGDLARAATSGIADLVASVWPSPAVPAGVGALTALGAIAAWAAVELVLRRTAPAALLPSLALAGVIALMSAEAGAPPLWWVVAWVVAALATLLPHRRRTRSGLAMAHAAIMTVLAVVTVLVAGSALAAERFDPRARIDAPATPETGISPLARLDEWRSRVPAVEVFRSTLSSAQRWRLVGLTRYDGRTWLPADDYRVSSSVVGPTDPDEATVRAEVRIGELDAAWLPMVDRTVEVSVEVSVEDGGDGDGLRVDETRSGLLPIRAPELGTVYELVLQPQDVQPSTLATARVATASEVLVDGVELSPATLELASTIVAGARTDAERAEAIARHLREQYVLDFDSPPGHSLAVLELFLERTKRGRDEQFVAAYGLLAHAVGLPVRIAVGFQSEALPGGGGTVASSDQAIAWPEVDFGELGWIAFDPVPAQANTAPPAQGDGAVAPIGDDTEEPPVTTAVPTPDSSVPDDSPTPDTVDETETSAVAATAVGAGVTLVIAATVLTGYVLCVLALKSHRRRRRRAATEPAARALGAFRSGVDVLVDLGQRADRSRTDLELVDAGARTLGEPALHLTPVATVATAAVHSPIEPTPEECERAWAAIESFEQATAARVGRLRYVRAKVSTRSLRRGIPD